MFKIAVALALLPSAHAMASLCNGDVLDVNLFTDCTLTYSTQAALDDSACPCTAGAGGVTGTREGTDYTFSKGSGWCNSDLDKTPASLMDSRWFTADECWDGCVTDNGLDALFGAEYDCDNNGCACYCQSSCDCMSEVGETSMLYKKGNVGAAVCADDDDDDDDSVEGEYYYCTCPDAATDETTCEAALSGAWGAVSCSMFNMMFQVPLVLCQPMYEFFSDPELASFVATCCADGLNGCTGVCVSSTSTVTAMTAANPVAHTVPIKELAVGDKILAATPEGKHEYDEVEGLLHGPSADHFVELTVSGVGAPEVVRATPHHTFPTCSFGANMHTKTTKAKDLAAGDCVMTATGKAKVTSVTLSPATKDEEAYTIVLKGKTDLMAVNGVFTHALPQAKATKQAQKKQTALRGSKAPEMTSFQTSVVDVVNSRVMAAVAKKTKAA